MKTTLENSNLSITNKRRIKVFIFILILTSIIWLLVELSKTYKSSATFIVEYKNLPTGKLLQEKPISEIDLAIEAPGFNLLKYKWKKHKIKLNLKSTVKKGASYFLLPNQQLSYLDAQLAGDIDVTNVLIDTIFVELGSNKTKKVPVKLNIDLNFKLGYNLIDKIVVTPDSIEITGTEKTIDSINEINTVKLELNDSHKNIDRKLQLELPKNKSNFRVSAKSIKIFAGVDKFTEGKLIIPVNFINVPEAIKVNAFPKQIEVVYQAGLSNFNKITSNSFLIVYDYNEYKNDTTIQYLTPQIKHKSEFISSIKINPSQIEFLIQK